MSTEFKSITQKILPGDYDSARVHLAWAINKPRLVLIFAKIELNPTEILQTPTLKPFSKSIGNTGWSFGYSRITTTVDNAFDFCKSFTDGKLLNFDYNTGSLQREMAMSGAELSILQAGKFKIPTRGAEYAPPYLATWQECAKIYELLPSTKYDISEILTEQNHRESAFEWFADWLHFDFRKYPEYIGAMVVVAPNPIFRSVDSCLFVDPQNESEESVLVRLHPRKGMSVNGLTAICRETESGLRVEHTFDQAYGLLKFKQKIALVSEEISCPMRGLLYHTPPLSFIRTISSKMTMKTAQLEVNVKDAQTGKEKQITVEKVEKLAPMIVGQEKNDPAVNAEYKRGQQREGQKYEQCWFGGNKREEATAYVLSILKRAERQAWIIDPYFGPFDFAQFFSAGGDWSVPVNILTSADYLRSGKNTDGHRSEEGFALHNLYESMTQEFAKKGLGGLPSAIRVMLGEKSPIHDRFIVADDDVWMIGSSLNELGNRGTLALKLPDPQMVLLVIEEEWERARDLSSWATDRASLRID